MNILYTILTVWMFISFIAATVMNSFFTINYLKQHNEQIASDIQLGALSNHLRALDVANENGAIPAGLKWQKRFYLQALLCALLMLGAYLSTYFFMR